MIVHGDMMVVYGPVVACTAAPKIDMMYVCMAVLCTVQYKYVMIYDGTYSWVMMLVHMCSCLVYT